MPAAEAARSKARAAFIAAHAAGAALEPLAGDASFRRYFRVRANGRTLVLMDAPPPMEDVRPFLRVRAWLEAIGVRAPALAAADEAAGFLLLEDFGDCTWAAHAAAGGGLDDLFADAWRQLLLLQQGADSAPALPRFDAARMHAECDLYLDWYLPRVAGYSPSEAERARFHAHFAPLIEMLAALPQVPVHLDWHSRNLMLPGGGTPLGVIDFQDAASGCVLYDAASLLYDCYQDYPETVREAWSHALFEAQPAGVRAAFSDAADWHRRLRMCALQRHVKAIGIFARLAWRDGKRGFLDEIPLTRRHLLEELDALGDALPGGLRDEPLLRMLAKG